MEPFSIATGVLGLLRTAATVIRFLDTVKSTIQDAPKTVTWALAEVSDVNSAIARLHGLFEHIDSIPEHARALVTVQEAAVTVSELVTSFDDLVDVLKPFGLSDLTLVTTWDKVKWARRQDDVAKVIMRLQTRKISLALMLNIFQCESDIVAVESRLALENGLNTVIEGNIKIQQRLGRMERLFEACVNNASPRNMLGYAGTPSDAMSARSRSMTLGAREVLAPPDAPRSSTAATPSSVVEAFGPTQDAGRIPMIKLEFEETLAETGVYRRVQRPLDAFSMYSSDDRSVTRTIMTTYSLADHASALSCYPIIDRTDLRHPEFYAVIKPEPSRESRFLSALVPRRRRSSDPRDSPQRPVSRQKVQTSPNCGPEVMGAWYLSTRRIWRSTEFRFETLFEVPAIFVCPPTNTRGRIKSRDIHFLDGTPESLERTRTNLPGDEARRLSLASEAHTADDERASWVMLLSMLQLMEIESQEWQNSHRSGSSPLSSPLATFSDHTLAIAVQAKQRSWDSMPAGVKPYATTSFCHILEIAAMLGIYWKEFDRSKERYRAEGNGWMVTGAYNPDLGIMFTFQLCGPSEFRENRVIPVDEVKELCCGFVSTIFRHERDAKLPTDLGLLQLGSMDDIASTLVLIGCNADTANYFRSKDSRHSHLFPVPFELLGMLGKTLRIRNSLFRMLPNPTPYHWDKNFCDLHQLVIEYWKKVYDSNVDFPLLPQIEQLLGDADYLVRTLDRDTKSKTPGYSLPLLDTLHNMLNRCDRFLIQESNQELVLIVIREHFQEVLKLINKEADLTSKDNDNPVKQRAETLSDLTAASPERR